MFFHIDESGNTGNNLFDPNQSKLSYGVLSARTNVEYLGRSIYSRMCKKLGVQSLHGNELGVRGLTEISSDLFALQNKMNFNFDYYFIDKPTFALVTFFEAVFDAGLNEAVPWITYWTPLRYPLLLNLSMLLDEDDLKESWRLCNNRKIEKEYNSVHNLLENIYHKVSASSLDGRSKEIFSDALRYGIEHPERLDFGTPDSTLLSPNAVCFQFVVGSMAKRLRKKGKKDALGIFVDQQSQFNRAQVDTQSMAKKIEEGFKGASEQERNWFVGHPMHKGLDEPTILRQNTPKKEISVRSSDKSIGLQIVDLYLWIINRQLAGKEISPELQELVDQFISKSVLDGISKEFLAQRWNNFENELPKFNEMTEEQKKSARDMVEFQRNKVRELF